MLTLKNCVCSSKELVYFLENNYTLFKFLILIANLKQFIYHEKEELKIYVKEKNVFKKNFL